MVFRSGPSRLRVPHPFGFAQGRPLRSWQGWEPRTYDSGIRVGKDAKSGYHPIHLNVSEPDDRAECDPQVILRPVVEVNLVAHLEPQSHRTKACFDPASRINCRV